jgi:hypothetical protein
MQELKAYCVAMAMMVNPVCGRHETATRFRYEVIP